MKSRTTERFRKALANLPAHVRNQVREAYQQFKRDPGHRSLRFKQVHTTFPIYSVRISKGYRALGQKDAKSIVWFWIGPHAEYDKLLSQM